MVLVLSYKALQIILITFYFFFRSLNQQTVHCYQLLSPAINLKMSFSVSTTNNSITTDNKSGDQATQPDSFLFKVPNGVPVALKQAKKWRSKLSTPTTVTSTSTFNHQSPSGKNGISKTVDKTLVVKITNYNFTFYYQFQSQSLSQFHHQPWSS